MSLFDLVAIAVCTYGLVFFLGVYAGRAAAWREGCWYVLGEETPDGIIPAAPAAHHEPPAPLSDEPARLSGSNIPTKVTSRRKLPPRNGRPPIR